jgi:hypothetical protein
MSRLLRAGRLERSPGRVDLRGSVAGAVDEARQVEAVAIDERGCLPRDGHVARDGVPEVELGLPAQVFLIGVNPQQELFLGGLRLFAVG